MSNRTRSNEVAAQEAFLAAKQALETLVASDPRYMMVVMDVEQAQIQATAYNAFDKEARTATFAKHAADLKVAVDAIEAINALHVQALAINAMPADIRAEYLAAIKPAPKAVVAKGTISTKPSTNSGKLLAAIQHGACTPEELLAMVQDRNGAPVENRLAALHKRLMEFKKHHNINITFADGKYSIAAE